MRDEDCTIAVKFTAQPEGDGDTLHMAKGGLAQAANSVRKAGRFGDSMVVHINKREFDEMRARYGDPHINPETGMPEFFGLDDVWDSVKKFVGPATGAIAGTLIPGIGTTLGSWMPGLTSSIGTTGLQALGSAALGAGAGYLADGSDGALWGGLAGGISPYAMNLLQTGSLGGLGAAAASGAMSPESAAAGQAAGALAAPAGVSGAGGVEGSLNWSKLPLALLAAGMDLASSSSTDKAAKKAAKQNKKAMAQFNKPLPEVNYSRSYIPNPTVPDYTQQGERNYYANNQLPVAKADGGVIRKVHQNPLILDLAMQERFGPDYEEHLDETADNPMLWPRNARNPVAAGGKHDLHRAYSEAPGGGRADDIPARLSNGEYVMDAATVAKLGGGNTALGAAALDQLRQSLR